MSKSALNFGSIGSMTSMFGSMGGNPSINALTNANAMAAQQAVAGQANLAMQAAAQPQGSGMIGDISQNVMDASMPTFDPSAQMAGRGIFGARGARNRSLFPSAIMNIDETPEHVKQKIAEKNEKDAAKPSKPRTKLMSPGQKDEARFSNLVNAVGAARGFLNNITKK